jgi:nucleotide-binding universal stress UspA family protein
MSEKILLLLDGSELAEVAIPHVRDLAGQLEAELYLLYACPPGQEAYRHMHQIYMEKIADNLKQMIRENSITGHEMKIQAEVINGEPLKVILDYIQAKSISMVALTSHGISGFRAWTMGSMADKVVRGAGIPTLFIRVKEKFNIPKVKGSIQKILVPVDTSDASVRVIPYAIQLAQKLKASITLFSMAQTVYTQYAFSIGYGSGSVSPPNLEFIDEATKKYTDEYLQGLEDEIRKAGVEATHVSNMGVDAADEILHMEKIIQPDLVMMSTRGRSNVARWPLGSVAEKVFREGDRPVLMLKGTAV